MATGDFELVFLPAAAAVCICALAVAALLYARRLVAHKERIPALDRIQAFVFSGSLFGLAAFAAFIAVFFAVAG